MEFDSNISSDLGRKYDIFISYRRKGAEDFARAIYQELRHRKYRVFLDRQDLSLGNYEQQVLEVIKKCRDVILILPRNALDRCGDEHDLFRQEIAAAIRYGKNIIPIVRNDFIFPEPVSLPEDIRPLLKQEAIKENPDAYDAVIDRLTEMLGRSVSRQKKDRIRSVTSKLKKIIAAAAACGAAALGIFLIIRFAGSGESEDSRAAIPNNNHQAVSLDPTIFLSEPITDNGRVQDVFLGQKRRDFLKTIGIPEENGAYSDDDAKYSDRCALYRYFMKDKVTSFPVKSGAEALRLYDGFADPLHYPAYLETYVENNIVVYIRYCLSFSDKSDAEKLFGDLCAKYGAERPAADNTKIRIPSAEALNGDLVLEYSENGDGLVIFNYSVENGYDLPSYMLETEEKETTPDPDVTIGEYKNREFHGSEGMAYKIENIEDSCEKITGNADSFSLRLTFYGTRVPGGKYGAEPVQLKVKLTDENGAAVRTESCYSPSVEENEKFKAQINIYNIDIAHKYTLELVGAEETEDTQTE